MTSASAGVAFLEIDRVPEPIRVRFADVTDDHIRMLAGCRMVWALPALLAIVTYGLVDRHRFAYPL